MDPQQPRDPQQPQDRPPDQPPAGEAQQGWSEPPPPQQGWAQAPPPQQGWAQTPPPQQGWAQGAGYHTAPPRPGGVTFAGIYLIVMGALIALAGTACAAFGGAAGTMFDFEGAGMGEAGPLAELISGALVFVGVIGVIIGILKILGGVGALQGKGWGRVLGIIFSVVFAVLFGLSLLSGVQGGIDASSMIFTLILGALYAVAAWALIKAGPYFAARR
jgi:hypothetical protein